MSDLLTVLVLIAGIVLYWGLAVLVGRAAESKGRNRSSWTVIAFVFGLIIPAVIVAAMAPNAHHVAIAEDAQTVSCPFCAEEIKPEAIKCKHCGEMLAS